MPDGGLALQPPDIRRHGWVRQIAMMDGIVNGPLKIYFDHVIQGQPQRGWCDCRIHSHCNRQRQCFGEDIYAYCAVLVAWEQMSVHTSTKEEHMAQDPSDDSIDCARAPLVLQAF